MGMFDGLAGGLGKQAAEMIAGKLGMDPSVAASALEALARNHPLPNDTVQQSSQETGLSGDMLNQVLGQIGGEGGLGALVDALGQGGQTAEGAGGLGGILAGLGGVGGIASMLDRDGDGNPLNDVMGMFGKK